MIDLATAIALVFVIEGILYALFPEMMKSMMARVMEQPTSAVRSIGLVSAVLGVVFVWLIKHLMQ